MATRAETLTVTGVAACLGVKEATVYAYRRDGILPEATMVGRTPTWDRRTIEEWMKARPGRGAGGGRPTGTVARISERARRLMEVAGGTAEDAGPLTQWALDHADERYVGVLVGEGGDILAHTILPRGDGRAWYVTNDDEHEAGVEVGLAVAHLRRRTGHGVIHVMIRDVTQR